MYSHLNFREKLTLYLNKWQKLRCCWLLALAHDEIFGLHHSNPWEIHTISAIMSFSDVYMGNDSFG